jgi:four helix bundle protein
VNFDKMNLIKSKSYQFALRIVSFYRQMQDQNEYVLSKQLLRAGTSIGAKTCPVKSRYAGLRSSI